MRSSILFVCTSLSLLQGCAVGPALRPEPTVETLAAIVAAPAAARQDSSEQRLPREGDRIVDARVYYGIPILQRSFFWDGNGEVDQFGLRLRHLWQTSDNVALGAGISVMNFLLGGADVQAAEVDVIGRFHVYRGESFAAFVEITGGFLQARDAIPPGGTEWNFTFSFGPGIDVPIGDNLDLITGVTYHHISNALGHENPRNPSQNEAEIWVGVDYRF